MDVNAQDHHNGSGGKNRAGVRLLAGLRTCHVFNPFGLLKESTGFQNGFGEDASIQMIAMCFRYLY